MTALQARGGVTSRLDMAGPYLTTARSGLRSGATRSSDPVALPGCPRRREDSLKR